MNSSRTADHEHEPCCEGPDSPCYICQPDAHNCSPTCRLHVTHVGPCLPPEQEEEVKRRHAVLTIAMGVALVAFVVALVLALQN